MRSIAEALTPTGEGKLLSAHASLKAGGGGGGGSAPAEYGHPGYRHLAWLGGKAGRVALAEFKASGEEAVLKLHEVSSAGEREADMLRLLAKSSAAVFVVKLQDAHPAGTEGDPRMCIRLEVALHYFTPLHFKHRCHHRSCRNHRHHNRNSIYASKPLIAIVIVPSAPWHGPGRVDAAGEPHQARGGRGDH